MISSGSQSLRFALLASLSGVAVLYDSILIVVGGPDVGEPAWSEYALIPI